MKRTNKDRCAELNNMLSKANIKGFFFGLAPKDYYPYRLYKEYENGAYTIYGGYYKEVRAVSMRMCMAATTGKTITSMLYLGVKKQQQFKFKIKIR